MRLIEKYKICILRIGRPSKLTPERVRLLSECIQNAMPTNIACDFANISRDTFYGWYKKDENFRTQMNYSKAVAIKRLIKSVSKKEPWKLLKNLCRGEFVDDPIVQINIEENSYTHLSTEDLEKALEIEQKALDSGQSEPESSD